MVNIDTDLSTLYVMSDDFCKWHLPSLWTPLSLHWLIRKCSRVI